jgi:hypothetical protein
LVGPKSQPTGLLTTFTNRIFVNFPPGSKAMDAKISVNSDFKSLTSQKHSIHFHLMIVTTMANFEMEIEEIRSQFWSTLSMASDNAILKKARRLLVLPFITGNLDSVTPSSNAQVNGVK